MPGSRGVRLAEHSATGGNRRHVTLSLEAKKSNYFIHFQENQLIVSERLRQRTRREERPSVCSIEKHIRCYSLNLIFVFVVEYSMYFCCCVWISVFLNGVAYIH